MGVNLNNKILLVMVPLAIIAVVVVAVTFTGDDDNDSEFTVIYDGNGGTFDGKKTIEGMDSKVSINFFVNGDKQFINWNTKSDGTGTSYKPGDVVPDGKPTLYAQWRDMAGVYHVTSYTASFSHFTTTLNGGALGLLTEVSSNHANIITLQPKEGVQNLACNYETGVFTYDYNSMAYTLTVKITGATGIVYDVDGGVALVGFKATSDVSITISEHPVR